MKMKRNLITILCLLSINLFAQVDLTTGLVAHYQMNGNADDNTSNQYNGTLEGVTSTTDRFGNENSALYFDGSSHIKITGISEDDFLTDNTMGVSLWIKQDELLKEAPFLFCLYGNSYKELYRIAISSSKTHIRFNDSEGTSTWPTSDTDLSLGEWTHIVATNTGGDIVLYINGNEVARKANFKPILNNSGTLIIGADYDNSSDINQFFKGSMDEIRVYNKALSYEEVKALYEDNDNSTGIEQIEAVDISIYPNPASKYIKIESEVTIEKAEITSFSGDVLVSTEVNGKSGNIDLEGISAGSYILRTTTVFGEQFQDIIIKK